MVLEVTRLRWTMKESYIILRFLLNKMSILIYIIAKCLS